MEQIKAVEIDVKLDLVGEEGTVPLDADALEKVAELFEQRYPQLYAACGGGLRSSRLGRAGLDVALTVTDSSDAIPALRTALEAVEDVLAEVGFDLSAADVYDDGESAGKGSPQSSSGRVRMRLAHMEVSESVVKQTEKSAETDTR